MPEVVEMTLHERQSPVVVGLTAVFTVIILVISLLILRYQGPVAAVQFVPTITPIPPTLTYTPTWTPLPSDTPPPTLTPTITPTPAPTDTPRPPRIHVIASGETLIGLSLLYRVSPDSIAAANGISVDAPVQVNQNLEIPWPTATPPLQMIAVEVNGETVVLDPADCQRYEVQEGDSLVGIAALFGINAQFLAEMNRITDPNLLQPGDSVCIPDVIYGGEGLLPPTAGPPPTISPTSPPPGPQLLFPADETAVSPPDAPVTLQWVAVKDLAADEMYMVELKNVDQLDSPAYRGFTRDTAFRVPLSWRPAAPQVQRMRWRVSIVRIVDTRADGAPIYAYGGESSRESHFLWLGAPPTATPTATMTPTPDGQ